MTSAWGQSWGESFGESFGPLEPATGMQVVLLPSGRRFRKHDLALYALSCYARHYAGAEYNPGYTYNPAAFKRDPNPLLSVFDQ